MNILVEVVNVVILLEIHFIRMMASFCRGDPFMTFMERFSIYRVEETA